MSGKRIPNETWENIDWSQTNSQIAQQIGVCYPTVSYHRRRRSPETYRQKAPARDWPDDLGKVPDVDIAARLGVSRQAVQQARRNRGIPPPPRPPSIFREKVLAALVRRALGKAAVGDEDVLWRYLRVRGGA